MSEDEILDRAAGALDQGRIVVIPTDTVYGLAARPDSPEAVQKIFDLKGRVPDKPLSVLGPDINTLKTVAEMEERALALASRYWPGPLTLVVRRRPWFTHDLGGGEDGSIAIRVPASEPARALLTRTGPLAVTSANRSGDPPANSVADAREVFGDAVSVYVDGGPVIEGVASTVVSLLGVPSVLRAGPIGEDEIRQTLTS